MARPQSAIHYKTRFAQNKAQAARKARRDKNKIRGQTKRAALQKKIATRRKKGKTAERKPDSVALANRHSFICAGGLLRPRASLRSATYPMCYGRAAPHPTLSCTELGLQCPSRLLRRRWSLTPPFHPYRLRGGIFSVALSMRRRFPPPPRPFKRSSALWCPDFPLGEPSECLLRSLRKKALTKTAQSASKFASKHAARTQKKRRPPAFGKGRRAAQKPRPR